MEINGSDSISNKIPATNGTVAQEVEQGTENPRVGGSTPPCPTKLELYKDNRKLIRYVSKAYYSWEVWYLTLTEIVFIYNFFFGIP